MKGGELGLGVGRGVFERLSLDEGGGGGWAVVKRTERLGTGGGRTQKGEIIGTLPASGGRELSN